MNKSLIIGASLAVFLTFSVTTAPAQIGQRIDRALERIGGELREGWDEARGAVHRMGLRSRVYSRLHWDKDLQDATIDIDIQAPDMVVLRGSVANDAAKQKAVQLARDTVGVAGVEDRLAVAPQPPAQRDPSR